MRILEEKEGRFLAAPIAVSSTSDTLPIPSEAPVIIQVNAYPRLTWAKSHIKEVKYNTTIEAWLNHDQAFANWIRTCIMVHAGNSMDETVLTVPDQFVEDVGERVVLVTVKDGVIHVMN